MIAPVSTADRQWHEEIFGPVVAVMPFEDEADAIRLANDTEYGLFGSLWTRDSGGLCGSPVPGTAGTCQSTRIRRCGIGPPSAGSSSQVWAGNSGPDALHAFTETKNVFISTEE